MYTNYCYGPVSGKTSVIHKRVRRNEFCDEGLRAEICRDEYELKFYITLR